MVLFTTNKKDFLSANTNIYKSKLPRNYYGDCSLMAKQTVVVRQKRVRFPPFALPKMETIKGFKDISGEQAQKRAKIKEIISNNFQLYGFEPAETPIIEYEKFVKTGNQADVISDIFKLKDKGKRNLALRYEFTFQLKRLAKNKKLPYKRYQIGPVFRDEPVSTKRFRQFTQCDADIIGSTIKNEAELLALTSKILKQLNIKATILINNRKLLNEILGNIKNKSAVIKELDKLEKLSTAEVKKNLKKYKAEKILSIFKKPKSFFKKYKAYEEIQELEKYCKLFNIKVKFTPSLARGLSYYNGSIFEIKSSKMRETIIAGGSYLVNNIQSTGISFGLDRLSQLADIKSETKQVLILNISQDKQAIQLAETLRNNNIQVNLWSAKGISKAFAYANSLNIPYVIILGAEEVKKKKVKFKDMKSGKERLVSTSNLVKILNSKV